MAKLVKKNTKGAAANYITRTRAIRKLQISISEFRRLCILKGIYPRAPKNKKKASGNNNNNHIFYLAKDIAYLMHEPLLAKFREQKIFLRKINKALAKRQLSTAVALEENKPVYSLDHLVKERYPTFIDSLRDLDDCLSHLFLFASLPASEQISPEIIQKSQRLCAEFLNYSVYSHSLKKCFVSIKGIYYQVEIKGQEITWLVPHQFSIPVPEDIDWKVMLAFLEFYSCMMGFVLFRLYSEVGLKYPPAVKEDLDDAGAGWLLSYTLKDPSVEALSIVNPKVDKKTMKDLRKQAMKQLNTLDSSLLAEISEKQDESEVQEEEQTSEPVTNSEADQNAEQLLFSKHSFFLSREVPRFSLEFVLRSFGGSVSWPETSGCGSLLKENDESITIQIVDRPPETLNIIPGRVYVQPQWVYDCVNINAILDTALYAPGKPLPPHLSPFKPNVVLEDSELIDEEEEAVIEGEEDDEDVQEEKDELLEEESEKVQQEKAKRKLAKEEEEKVQMAKMMLSNKKRKVVERIQSRKAEEKKEHLKLLQKKKNKKQ